MTNLRTAAQQALETPGCERLKDWYEIGPVQRAALETFLEAALSATHGGMDDLAEAEKREWVELTDEEITALKRNGDRYISSQDFARAIEAKLREKNGGGV